MEYENPGQNRRVREFMSSRFMTPEQLIDDTRRGLEAALQVMNERRCMVISKEARQLIKECIEELHIAINKMSSEGHVNTKLYYVPLCCEAQNDAIDLITLTDDEEEQRAEVRTIGHE